MIGALITVVIVLLLLVGPPVLALRTSAALRRAMEQLERRLAMLEDVVLRGRRPDAAAVPAPAVTETTPARHAPAAADDPAASSPRVDPPTPTQPAHPTTAPARLETRIGAQWMLYAGVMTLVIGMGLFIRFAFVNQWVTEPLRVAIGGLTGLVLTLAGIFRTNKSVPDV